MWYKVADDSPEVDPDVATRALLAAEAAFASDAEVAAAVGHGGPFLGFGARGGWRHWHSSGRAHAGGSWPGHGHGARGVAGNLGGDAASGWGSAAALQERFHACARAHPGGGGELTKDAFKALVHEMTEESDPDGTLQRALAAAGTARS